MKPMEEFKDGENKGKIEEKLKVIIDRFGRVDKEDQEKIQEIKKKIFNNEEITDKDVAFVTKIHGRL